MKIVFTGGGSGGHFYPLMAIAEAIKNQIEEQNIVDAKLYYIADKAYDEKALFVNELEFVSVPTGKMRLYFSIQNFFDLFKTFGALFNALLKMIQIYPDVVISKGGYPAFPVVVAAWILRIPVVMHESDMAAGRVNKITSKFAKRIAVSFPNSINIFGKDKITAWSGQPIRKEMWETSGEGTRLFFKIEDKAPIVVIYGGSKGSEIINSAVFEILKDLVEDFQIIHQVGTLNEKTANSRAQFALQESQYKNRYRAIGFFNPLMLKMLGASADLFITRGGAGSIFDMALWNKPAIIIPITNSNGNHQRLNSYSYAATGAAIVIEEKNLEPNVFLAEIRRIMSDDALRKKMSQSGEVFVREDAAEVIAKEALSIALKHEK
jgi:UDP-N-acetylglucosamine--N-acetylmuramyl-(pentapeptide) pyrophosphoryl-undecaprenol N-acetylglucosamine transferase